MAITASMVKELREMTGAGMMDCKKALNESNGDMDAAIEYLRKNGEAKAVKKAGRIAAEGIVMADVKEDKTAAIVEVNSETDFVAKNADFQAFVKAVVNQALTTKATDMEGFMAEAWNEDASKTVNDALTEKISVIGEKLSIRRFEKIVTDGCVVSYIHGGGRIGVLVEADTAVVNDAVKEALKNVAMQVAALNAKYVSQADVDADYIAHEKEILLAQIMNDPKESQKPEKVIQGMISGRINKEMNGQLTLAIQIFKDEYPKRFLHQLVSGQLDMDRLDYLRRDSFYTGVTEGNIGSARIIKMLDVKDDHLVVESKGIYSIENFLTARRLMYWQVYLHKTSVAYEKMLISTLLRAKELAGKGVDLFAPPALKFFLYNDISRETFYNNPDCLENYIQLDDNDLWTALKVWSAHSDKVLSTLSLGMINRNIFKVEISTEPFSEERKKEITRQISKQLDIPLSEAGYFISTPGIEKNMYDPADDSIDILYNDGSTKNIAEASDMLNISLLSKKVKKYYLCYQRLHR